MRAKRQSRSRKIFYAAPALAPTLSNSIAKLLKRSLVTHVEGGTDGTGSGLNKYQP
jgi:hypothetical protein